MTRYEAEATNGFGGGRPAKIDWSQLLVPLLAAVLVLALGLAMVIPASISITMCLGSLVARLLAQ